MKALTVETRCNTWIVRAASHETNLLGVARSDRRERLELFNTVVVYGGTFRVDGDRVIHNVDIFWNENWTGTAQVRRFRIHPQTYHHARAPSRAVRQAN